MKLPSLWRVISAAALLACVLIPGAVAAAAPRPVSPAELINAVNNLRLSRGLAPLSSHPILMQVAQSQSDALLATEGAVGHGRPNGMTFTQQLLLLGYPLSGDLSLGGFRSENFIFGYQLSAADAVEAWLGDAPHTNTMLSPDRSDIGAGVSTGADGAVYYVIDTALQTSSGLPQSDADLYLPGGSAEGLDPEAALNQYIVPVAISTARPNGDVYHTVQYGQSLWAIAIEYGTKIDQIRSLNHLGSDTVFPNQLLLVKQGATQPAPLVLPPPEIVVMASPTQQFGEALVAPVTPPGSSVTKAAPAEPVSRSGPSVTFWATLAIFLVVAAAGSAIWFIREPGP